MKFNLVVFLFFASYFMPSCTNELDLGLDQEPDSITMLVIMGDPPFINYWMPGSHILQVYSTFDDMAQGVNLLAADTVNTMYSRGVTHEIGLFIPDHETIWIKYFRTFNPQNYYQKSPQVSYYSREIDIPHVPRFIYRTVTQDWICITKNECE